MRTVLRPLEPVDLREGEEVVVEVKRTPADRAKAVERLYGERGPAPKELLDEFMLEAELE